MEKSAAALDGAPDAGDDLGHWRWLPLALYRTGADGRIVDVNQAFVECFRGEGPSSLLHTPAGDLYADPDERDRAAARALSPDATNHFEARMRRLDGTTFWAHGTTRLTRNAAGELLRSDGLIQDVTAWRSSQQSLQASEVRYRRLFETAKDGILILNAETADIVDVNPFLCTLLGLTYEHIVGRKLWEIGPFKDVAASQVGFRRLQATEYIRYEDLPLETATGQKIAVEFVSNVYLAAGEKVIQCNVRDITERKQNAEEHARLIRAVQQAAESIVMADPDGTIVYVNPAFERISGWEHKEAVGQSLRILRNGHDDAFYRKIWEVLARGEVWAGRLLSRRKDGTVGEEEATISPVRDAAGRVVNYVAVSRDTSSERSLEQQLLQAQKMEAVGRLAGGVAHDFNNLLGVIMGYGQIVHRQLDGEDPLKAKVGEILKAADRAAALTRQLLAFGRKQVLQPKVLDLNAVVGDTERMLQRVIGEHVELVTVLAPELGSVRADPGQVEQVLMNLVVNARDAMPQGGRIVIETGNAELDADFAATHRPTQCGSYVMVAVADSGLGMDPSTQTHVFEPFFSTKDVGKGTGLGLSTVYGIVKQSGGYVWVDSKLGEGTTFKVYFPRVDGPAAPAQDEQPARAPRGAETVLLVEDEASLRELLREALESAGYSVLVAREGAEALEIARAHAGPIPLMVTDVIMPGIGGPRVAELVTGMRPDMKVLFISGYSDESVVRHGLVGPGRAFLSKPFPPEVLLRKVRESLDASLS